MCAAGDYYACAKLAGAPPPSGATVIRGLAGEGWGLLMCGLFGTSNGTTSYGENIGAIAVTRVGSRAVVQCSGLIMCIMGLFPKFAAIFVALPDPIIAAMHACFFGMISSAGLSPKSFVPAIRITVRNRPPRHSWPSPGCFSPQTSVPTLEFW